ncbi:hypothetical protein ACERNI_07345 [Camelimonas sp. ID_303_24]
MPFLTRKTLFTVATGVFVAGIAAMVFMQDAADIFWVDNSLVSDTPTRDLHASEQAALAKSLSPGLNDPESVQWRWLPLNMQTFEKGQGRYCGYLNAKDGAGNYLGFQPFLAAVRTARKEIRSGELALVATDAEAMQVVKRMCAQSGYNLP